VLTQGPSFFASSGKGVVVTATGQLIGFNLDDLSGSVGVVFTPPPGEEVAAAQALADGDVMAVLSSGTVEELAPAADGLAVDSTLVPLTGIPSEPSALAVLQGESGMQVLVTAADGDRVFAFGIPEQGVGGAPVFPPPSTGPVVEVTPLAGEPLTVVVTLTAGTGPAGGMATSTTLVGNVVAAEAEEVSDAGLLIPGQAALGAVSPAWALGLVARLQGAAVPEDAAGEVAVEVGPKPVAAAVKPRPAEDGLDLDKLLRELDLYQPMPSRDRPVPFSGRPGERRDQEFIARTTPSVDAETVLADLALASEHAGPTRWWARVAAVVEAMVSDLGAAPTQATVSDAMMASELSSWEGERWRLLGLAGLVLWQWPGYRSESDGVAESKQQRQRR
jgi:hypothetical protein